MKLLSTNISVHKPAVFSTPQMHRSLIALIASALWFVALPWAGAAEQAALSGTFLVAGKAAALKYASAYKGEPESGKPVTVLVLTAKDQSKDSKATVDALFGKFGDAIVVKVFDDGKIYSADVLHSGFDLPNNTLTLFGDAPLSIKDFKNSDGAISGTLTSGGAQEVRGQKWEVNLTFKARYRDWERSEN
jgi:hypothetical protein